MQGPILTEIPAMTNSCLDSCRGQLYSIFLPDQMKKLKPRLLPDRMKELDQL